MSKLYILVSVLSSLLMYLDTDYILFMYYQSLVDLSQRHPYRAVYQCDHRKSPNIFLIPNSKREVKDLQFGIWRGNPTCPNLTCTSRKESFHSTPGLCTNSLGMEMKWEERNGSLFSELSIDYTKTELSSFRRYVPLSPSYVPSERRQVCYPLECPRVELHDHSQLRSE